MEGQGPGPQFGDAKVQTVRGDYVKVPSFFCPLGNAWMVPAVVFWQLTMTGGLLTFDSFLLHLEEGITCWDTHVEEVQVLKAPPPLPPLR